MSASATSKRKRRLRFSLRALLVCITLFMLWGGYHTNRAWEERAAVQVLTRDQLGVNYGPPKPQPGFFNQTKYAYQKVVQRVWGEPFVTSVTLFAPLDPEVVDALCVLPHVQSIHIGPPEFTEEERIRHAREHRFTPRFHTPPGAIPRILAANPQLRGFWCQGWCMSDEDCHAIACHPTMIDVSIDLSNCSEAGFAEIATAPRLQYLSFTTSNVTGSELSSRSGSLTLTRVTCDRSPVGKEFAAFIARSPNVTSLQASCASIDDPFVAELTMHSSLNELSLIGSSVTPASLLTIESMPSLQLVQLPQAAACSDELGKLRRSKPALTISLY